MVDVVSNFAAKVGQLVVNLATRKNVHVSLSIQESLLNKQQLQLKVTMMHMGKSYQVVESLTEAAVEDIHDVGVVADAIHNKLAKMS